MSSFCPSSRLAAGLCLTLSLAAMVQIGCTSQQEQVAQEQEESNLTLLKNLIGQYQARNRGQLPPNEQALRKYIEEYGQYMLNKSGAATVDDLLTSERDGKKFVVLYGKPIVVDEQRRMIAHEQEGKDGIIMWTDGLVVYPEKEEDFRKLVAE